jgi:hypothetical protein
MTSATSPAKAAPGPGIRYRLGVLSRTVAAIAGGYGVAALAAAALALCLPTTRAEAAMTGTLAAFVVYPIAVMWVFACASAWRAWVGLALAALLPGAVVLAFGYLAGGAA